MRATVEPAEIEFEIKALAEVDYPENLNLYYVTLLLKKKELIS